MPKAYPDEEEAALIAKRQREQEFAEGMSAYQEKFFGAVSDGKPYLDYVALLTGGAIVSAVLFTAIHAFFNGAWSTERSLLIAVVAGYMWFKFIPHMVRASGALADMSLIRLAKLLVTLRWVFECYTMIALGAVVLASVWVGYEIGERTGAKLGIEIRSDASDAKAPDAKTAPDAKATEAKPEAKKSPKAEPAQKP